jgi:high-affinity nickel-transport protein
MNFAYGWAFSQPVRKVYYNITITGLSIVVAFLIGIVELLQIVQSKLGLAGGFWRWIAGLDLNVIGYGIVALFALTWAAALAIWRIGRIEQRWSADLRQPS